MYIPSTEDEQEFERRAQEQKSEDLRRAKALLKLINQNRFSNDVHHALVVWKRYMELPADVRAEAESQRSRQPKAGGRRDDLDRARGEMNRRRPDRPIAEPFVVKVSIAGSGYGMWKTQVSKGEQGEELDWDRQDDLDDQNEVAHYTRDQGKGSELMFAGPGGKGTSGPGGMFDRGSNSIANLVEQVPPLVKQKVDEGLKDGDQPLLILIKAHSRGAVAASQVAEVLRKDYPDAEVELVLIDPVPGPGQKGKSLEIDLPDLDEFTLVYSVASGYSVGFTPQKVLGAHRIIISRQNHSVGLDKGFQYKGQQYKGSRLNSLPDGVYVDLNADGANTFPLVRVADMNEATETIQAAFKASSAWTRDSGRMDIIEKVLKDYLDKA